MSACGDFDNENNGPALGPYFWRCRADGPTPAGCEKHAFFGETSITVPLIQKERCRHLKILALDFDGVICHSSREIFLVTLRTYAGLGPFPGATERLEQLRTRLNHGHDFGRDSVYQAFAEMLPLGNRGEDFAVALKAVMSGLSLVDQDAYDRYFMKQDAGWKDAFHRDFYEQRAVFRGENEGRWLALHGTWPEFADLLRAHAGFVDYAICTAKDGVSVRKLLAHFGIDDLFPDDLILDKETGAQKIAHLTELILRTGVNPAEITFVDDKVSHLQKVSPLGVRCVLAAWGDNGDREYIQARRDGFAVADLENAGSILFGDAAGNEKLGRIVGDHDPETGRRNRCQESMDGDEGIGQDEQSGTDDQRHGIG